MEDSRHQVTTAAQANTLPESLESADASSSMAGYASGLHAAASPYTPDSLDVHEPGSAPNQSFNPAGPDVNSILGAVKFSRNKALIVSVIITAIVLVLTSLSLTVFNRQPSGTNSAANSVPIQELDMGDGLGEAQEVPELAGLSPEERSLLVNGNVISRGFLQFSRNSQIGTIDSSGLASNQNYQLPNASGAFCLDSNNCGYVTPDQIQNLATLGQLDALAQQIPVQGNAGVQSISAGSANLAITTNANGAVTITDTTAADPKVTSLNGQSGTVSLIIQGTPNQVTVSASGNSFTVSTPQDINTGSSPTFSGLILSSLDCTGFTNGGALTANASGQLVCSNDDGGSGAGVTTSGGTTGTIPVFTGPQTIDNSIVTQSGSTITITGGTTVTGALSANSLSLNTALGVGEGGTGNTSFTANSVILGNGTGALSATAAPLAGQILLGNGSGVPTFTSISGDIGFSSSGVTTIQPNSVDSSKIADASVANTDLTNSSLTVTAGNGLTNGGSVALGGSTTLNIGQGDGITVNANDVAVDTTVCRTSGNCAGVGGTGDVLQGGNSFGTAMTIGTNDSFAFNLETNGGTRLSISNTGALNLSAYNCSTFANGGVLTTDASGNVTCANDDGGAGSAITGSGTNGTLARFTGAQTIGDSIITESGTTITVAGTLAATNLQGNGSGITDLNGSNISTGTVANARLVGSGSLTVTAGNGLTNGGSVALGGSTTLNIGQGDGITVNANDITLALQANKGLEVDGNGLSLIDCASGEILKYNGTNQWACAADAGASGTGDDIYVNGTALDNADFVDSAATGSAAAITWSRTAANPDIVGLAIGAASNTTAGILTTGAQTIAGAKTFTSNLTIQGGTATLGSGTGNAGSLVLHDNDGTGSETVTITTPDIGTAYTLVLPTGVGSTNQCLKASNGTGNLFWDDCEGGAGGTSGVTSLNSLTGGLTLANASGSGSTITIDDATTTSKGIASFNNATFSVTAGAVSIADGSIGNTQLAFDTGQHLTTTSSPTFSALNVTNDVNITTGVLQTGGITRLTNPGVLQNITGITSSGTITFSSLSTAGIVKNNASGVLSTGQVSLGSEVSGTLPVANGGTGTNTQFTQGSVVFAGASGVYSQNNANLFFDNTNATLGIGTTRSGAINGSGNSRLIVQGSGSTSATSALNVRDSSGTGSLLLVRDDGNVGIGTSTPTSPLDVNGTITATGYRGAGLVDCDAGNSKLLWDATTRQFSCGTDTASVTIRKAANQNVSSDDTVNPDNNLFFTAGANETWIVRIVLYIVTSTAAGFRTDIINPSGSTCHHSMQYSISGSGAGSARDVCNTNNTVVFTSDVESYIEINSTVVTGSSGGTIGLEWAQRFPSSNVTTVRGGYSYLVAYKVTGADLAEAYYTNDATVNAGDVVMVDGSLRAGVQKTNKAYDSRTLGIIATQPGLIMGDSEPGDGRPVLLALAGRVPVKMWEHSEPVQPGDYITTSPESGKAMKATRAGQMIGKAMEAWDPGGIKDMVSTFINTGYADPNIGDLADGNKLNISGQSTLADLNVTGTTTARNLEVTQDATIAKLTVTNAITTQDLKVVNTATIANLQVTGDAEFRGSITVAGHIAVGEDTSGTAVIPAGTTEIEIAFTDPYGQIPKVVATADGFVLVKVTEKTINGFKLQLQTSQTEDVEIDWIALEPAEQGTP